MVHLPEGFIIMSVEHNTKKVTCLHFLPVFVSLFKYIFLEVKIFLSDFTILPTLFCLSFFKYSYLTTIMYISFIERTFFAVAR